MRLQLRLLRVDDEAAALKELRSVGADPSGVQRMAGKMLRRLVKVSKVPCRAANILKQEMLALGGDAAVARGSVACAVPHTDVILIGSDKKLRLLCERLAPQPFGLAELGNELCQLLDRYDLPAPALQGCRCRLDLSRPRIMGILNVTPDSFSDGGAFASLDAALRHALQMVEEGADLIDIGGESTRPGAAEVSGQEEMDRVVPVVEALRRECDIPLSIDTTKSGVARAAIAAGANFINDISGLRFDSTMASAAAESGAGLFIMHTRGRPGQMQQDLDYDDMLAEILAYLEEGLDMARAAGIAEERLAIDPGIGFGKSAEGNLHLLNRLSEFKSLGKPILLGTSRKRFIGTALGQEVPRHRLAGSLATVALGVERGATIFRVHDVGPTRDVALMAWAICQETMPTGH